MNPPNNESWSRWKKHNDVVKVPSFHIQDTRHTKTICQVSNVLDDTMTFLLEQSDEQKTICSWQAILVLG